VDSITRTVLEKAFTGTQIRGNKKRKCAQEDVGAKELKRFKG
jgi:hypothetical protein